MLELGINPAAPAGQLPGKRGVTVEFRTKRGVVAVTLDPEIKPADQEEAVELARAVISQVAVSQASAKAPVESGKPIRRDDGALFRSWALGSS